MEEAHIKTSRHKAGKTWQRIVDDILRYFPRGGFLANTPYDAAKSTPINSTVFPAIFTPEIVPFEEEVDEFCNKFYFILTNFRYHVELTVRTSNRIADHDFHLVEFRSDGLKEYYRYESTATDTYVDIEIFPPELSDQDLKGFELQQINDRYQKYKHLKPNTHIPSPSLCYSTLFKIIKQPLISDERKEISDANATLLLRVDRDLLPQKLFFTYDEAEHVYSPPDLSKKDAETKEKRRVLTRLLWEIATLYLKAQRREHPNAHQNLIQVKEESVVPILKEVLPHPNPSANQLGLNMPQIPNEIYQCYVALGACEYFNSDLLAARYDLQSKNDPRLSPLYLESLLRIAEFTGDQMLEVKVVEKVSLGMPTWTDLRNSYKKFGFDVDHSEDVEDDVLIAAYTNKIIQDPSQKQEMKSALETIATCRSGYKLNELLSIENMTVDNALTFLGASEGADDEIIKTAFNDKMAQSFERQGEMAKQALFTIAKHRLSNSLLSYYEMLIGVADDVEPHLAYGLLGCEPEMDPENILILYEIRVKEDIDSILQFRQALRSIANDKNSTMMKSYLGQGPGGYTKDPSPVGLDNIGNTCYLNSLLQFLFTITPLREVIIDYKNHFDDSAPYVRGSPPKKIGDQMVPAYEIKRSQMFVKLLGELFREMKTTKASSVVPKKDLAYMALIPPSENKADFEPPTPEPTPAPQVNEAPEPVDSSSKDVALIDVDEPEQINHIDLTQEDDVKQMDGKMEIDVDVDNDDVKENVPPPLPARNPPPQLPAEDPNKFPTTEQIESGFSRAGQQDVTECLDNVIYQIQLSFKGSEKDDDEQVDIIKKLFSGKTKAYLESLDGSNKRSYENQMGAILLSAFYEGLEDVYDAIEVQLGRSLLNPETYQTETVLELPEIIQLQIHRVDYNRELQRVFKNCKQLKFYDRIYMDRYMDTDDPAIIQKRKDKVEWKAEIKRLSHELEELQTTSVTGMSRTVALAACRDWLVQQKKDEPEGELAVSDATLETLNSEIARLQEKVESINNRIAELKEKCSNQFKDMTSMPYRMFCIFIHRGSAYQGHYWNYIYDFKKGIYRKYNDEYVTEVNESEVFTTDESDSAPTPYYVVYVREDLADGYIEAMPSIAGNSSEAPSNAEPIANSEDTELIAISKDTETGISSDTETANNDDTEAMKID